MENITKASVKNKKHLYKIYKKNIYDDQVILGFLKTPEIKKMDDNSPVMMDISRGLRFLQALQYEMSLRDFSKEEILKCFEEFYRVYVSEIQKSAKDWGLGKEQFKAKMTLIIKMTILK